MKQGRNTAGTLTITGGDTARTGRYVSQAEKAAVRAEQSAAVAEAWAVGEKGGAPVGSTDETFHNNARHFAEQAAASVTFAQAARTAAESAKDAAEAAADSVTGSAAQIQSNKQDVHDLKSAKAPVIIDTASGAITSFEDGADGMPIKALTVNIEPVQDGEGDPSPENVRPITGWTGCNIVRSPTLNAQDGTIYPITFPTEAGTVYDGTIDVLTGELSVSWQIADLGTLAVRNSRLEERNGVKYAVIQVPDRKRGTDTDGVYGLCDSYKFYGNRTSNALAAQLPNNSFGYQTTQSAVWVRNDNCETLEAYKSALSGVCLAYELANPITCHIAPIEVTTLPGTNNIWADCGEVSVEYSADTKRYIKCSINALYKNKVKIVCVGDSITHGDYGSNPAGTANDHYESYPYFLAKQLDVTYKRGWVADENTIADFGVINLGMNGASPKGWYNAQWENYSDIFKYANNEKLIVIIMFGLNCELTDTVDTDTAAANTQIGYYKRIIEEINTASEGHAQIILVTPTYVNPEMRPTYSSRVIADVPIVKKLAAFYNLPCIDAFGELGLSAMNTQTFQPIDGLHMGEFGYQRLGSFILSQVRAVASYLVWAL